MDEAEYEKLSNNELRDIFRERGLKNYSGLSKAKLIARLLEDDQQEVVDDRECKDWKVAELKARAKAEKLKRYSKLRKAELCNEFKIPGSEAIPVRPPKPRREERENCSDYRVPELKALAKVHDPPIPKYYSLDKATLCNELDIPGGDEIPKVKRERKLRPPPPTPPPKGPLTHKCITGATISIKAHQEAVVK